MAKIDVTRTLDVPPDALWRCVRAFGDVPWMEGEPEVRGEGVGQVRIFDRPSGKLREELTSLDDATRTLTYTIPDGIPFPARSYEATMTVTENAGRGRLSWSAVFEPEGDTEQEVAERLQQAYARLIGRIEEYLRSSSGAPSGSP